MQEEACLVTTGTASAEDEKLRRLLEFFGVEFVWLTPNELNSPLPNGRARVLCSAQAFAEIRNELRADCIHSVFVYSMPSSSDERCTATFWTIADDPVAGAMSGLRIATRAVGRLAPLGNALRGEPLISCGEAAVFVRSDVRGVPVFLSLGTELIDLDAELTSPNFDVRDHILAAVPVVMYLRWAFPKTAWHATETGACLVIDDPLVRPRYGFIRFGEMQRLMERHNFSACVAFIPWNWRRNDPDTVRLFKESGGRYSVAVHGCDHTAAEFGSEDPAELRPLVVKAANRMAAHAKESGLEHARVMVFPQGVFSEAAIAELKQGGFEAAVNTEVKAVGRSTSKVTIADVWNTALMRYADFAIYTRRYPRQRVENLAFDILLGKPCLIVIHHDFCGDGYKQLIEFVEQVNAIKAPLAWRSLGDVLARSYRMQETSEEEVELEMFGNRIVLENKSELTRRFHVRRQEREAAQLLAVRLNGANVPCRHEENFLGLDITLAPNESKTVELVFQSNGDSSRNDYQSAPAMKARLRRYLCEVRDNYVMPLKSRLARAAR
jgi:hypothetical protein